MLLVDGHNLIGRTPGLSLSREESSREQVLQRVAAAKGSGGERVVVVFDGNRPGSAKEQGFGGVRVVDAETPAQRDSRLRICDLTARVLKLGLSLLGIHTVEQM